MKKGLFLLLLLSLISSCQLYDRLFKGEVVARAGKSVLYKSDIQDLIPSGTSPEDSTYLVNQFINSWATKHLLLSMAESQLPKSDKDVQKEMDEFRTSLLVYRYERLFVEQRLDTLITDQECEQYYKDNRQSFITPFSVIKGRYVKISLSSPNFQIIKSLYRKTSPDDITKLEELCYSSADKHTDFNGEWVPLTAIAKELDMDISVCESDLAKNGYIEKTFLGYAYLVNVYEKIAPGSISPYEYNIERIKESILSKRKQELISSLERNLLNDALNNNKLLIYSHENND